MILCPKVSELNLELRKLLFSHSNALALRCGQA